MRKFMRKLLLPYLILSFLALTSFASCTKTSPSKDLGSTSAWVSSFSVVNSSISDPNGGNFNFSTTDSSGNLYISANTTGPNTWKILRSTDQGATWSVSDSNPANFSYGWRLAGDSLGNVFAAGATSPDNIVTTGVIRKFNGTAWSTVHSYQMEAGQNAEFKSVAVDASDNIYITGTANVATPSSRKMVVVLKSTNNGASWTLIDTFSPYEAAFIQRNNVIVHGGAVYVSGSSTSVAVGSNPHTWVRKSSDGGATWNTIYEQWGAYIEDMISWNGGIVILQDYDRGTDNGKIKVLATSNDFQNLTLLYTAAPSTIDASYAASLATDSRGYLYASGVYSDSSFTSTSFIAATRNGSTWTKIVEKTAAITDLESEWPDRVFVNSNNEVFYVAPYTNDGGTTNTLRIYKATITDPSTFTLAAIGNGSAKVSPISSGSKIIFVTTNLTDGNLGADASTAITNADAFCNADSNKPTFATGTFKALLVATGARIGCSTANCGGGAGEHTNWPLAANTSYVTRFGLSLGTTNAVGVFTSISATNYLGIYTPVLPWNGLDQSAANYWMTDFGGNCSDWTSNNGGNSAWTLDPTQTALTDFYSQSGANSGTCDEQRPLVCVEQ